MFDDEGMEEIREIFLEESNEGLDVMESGLLSLEPGTADLDTVNNIFRAAHSIKGGGGTFGFTEVSDFTHGVETVLDQMRDGVRDVTESAVQLLLESVDCLRDMMNTIRDQGQYDTERIANIQTRIEALLADDGAAGESDSHSDGNTDSAPVADSPMAAGQCGWRIHFKPHSHLLKTGNEPLLIIRALQQLGELDVAVDISALPDFASLDVEACYLSWELTLQGDVAREQVEELFEWVEGDCDLEITRLGEDVQQAPVDNQPSIASQQQARDSEPPAENKLEPAPPSEKPARESGGAPQEAASSSIRVSIEKIDSLLNLVGELVITQSMLGRFKKDFTESDMADLRDGLAQLENNTRELQESAMQIRMLPIKVAFSRFTRLVRDLSRSLGKQVKLEVCGEQTELDKTILEKIGDPLVHLVRNSLDHGIETVEKRRAAGKPEQGLLRLSAYHEAGNIVIEIEDDGAGLNRDRILEKARQRGLVGEDEQLSDDRIHHLIFQPGFSTAEQVSDVSGRGVGMDVVRRNIQDLGGRVDVVSEPGVGSTFTIRLPLTLAILDGQLVGVGSETYVVPLLAIVESVLIDTRLISVIANDTTVYRLREDFLPVADLRAICNGTYSSGSITPDELAGKLMVVIENGGKRYGIVVDDLQEQQQVVIKSLESNYKHVHGLAGATILGDGTVALILDIPGLVQRCFVKAEPQKQLAMA